jgi:hypothetical protein
MLASAAPAVRLEDLAPCSRIDTCRRAAPPPARSGSPPIAIPPASSTSHYFDVQRPDRGLVRRKLGYDFAGLVMGSRYGFPFVHRVRLQVPTAWAIIDLTLLVERIGRSSLRHRHAPQDGVDGCAPHGTPPMSLETRTAVALPADCATGSRPIAGAGRRRQRADGAEPGRLAESAPARHAAGAASETTRVADIFISFGLRGGGRPGDRFRSAPA